MIKLHLGLRAKMQQLDEIAYKLYNTCITKDEQTILFVPHYNCEYDGYDILNGESDNVLCLFNDMLLDDKFKGYKFIIVYYHKEKLPSYIEYVSRYTDRSIEFVYKDKSRRFREAFYKSAIVFTDETYALYPYKTKTQKVVCLNYFGGLIKNEFHRWTNHGGYSRMLQEQKMMNRCYDYHLSLSDISSKFIALDNCFYYPHFLSLGFPRNDIFFTDQSLLRKSIESLVDFPVKKIITLVPTHRDYESQERVDFYDVKAASTKRTIWGKASEEELDVFNKNLEDTGTLIIAKVHPRQERSVLTASSSNHILFYHDIVKNVRTSLNPLLAISDSIITDYTTTVYDFLYTNRPIIYYFYDIEKYRSARGFFIEPIESICAGHLTYNLQELAAAIRDIANNQDIYSEKRKFLIDIFIKHFDGKSSDRIKNYFFK